MVVIKIYKNIANVYIDGKWFKEIVPEGKLKLSQILECVYDSLKEEGM